MNVSGQIIIVIVIVVIIISSTIGRASFTP